MQRLLEVVKRLRAPDGCAWDREQTHASLKIHLLEEAHEVMDALEAPDSANFREELGDLLLQVVMHAEIASERGAFGFNEVADGIAEKLVRRHPHVFENPGGMDTEAVLRQWEEIKKKEKGDHASMMDGIARALPALMRAEKVQKKAAKVGFDWPDIQGPTEKVQEELAELLEAHASKAGSPEIFSELGDLLFSVVNLGRKMGLNPELALEACTRRFESRFRFVEKSVVESGDPWEAFSLEALDRFWDEAKLQEQAEAARNV